MYANLKQLTPQLLKPALTTSLNSLLDPIRAEYAASPTWQAVSEQAYPPEKAAVKVKKQKDKGDLAKRAAATAARKGAAGVVAQPDGHVNGPEKGKVVLMLGQQCRIR
jgi:tyrosyl-tRNA synthetase